MTKKILIKPQKTPLKGIVTVPGDKSISHRAVMFAAIADGVSQVRDWLPAGDTRSTLEAIQSMGVQIEIDKKSTTAWDLTIHGRGLHGLQPPTAPLDCRNAGTFMRLMAGILAGQRFPSVLDGSEQLRKRPMGRIITPLTQMGAKIEGANGPRAADCFQSDTGASCPLHISPSNLQGIRYTMPVASAQIKSATLLAGLYAEGETAVYQPGPARDHTERMLTAMGVNIQTDGNWVTLTPPTADQPLTPFDITVPADMSSAAFPLVAASIVPHSEITLRNVNTNSTRTGILEMLKLMGASFTVANEHLSGGEPIADLTVTFDELHAAEISGEMVVCGIDEVPIWAVAATQAAGRSTVRDAAELRVKEVDRISVLAGELRKLGIQLTEQPDGFTVDGPLRLFAADVDSHDDHRLGMSLAVAGLVTHGMTMVHDAGCVADSFPGFVELMQNLGAEMSYIED